MPYGILKVDTITFTAGGVDTSVSISGLVQNPTFTGNITSTGTISGNIIQGGTTVSGATVTGTAGQFGTLTGNTAGFTTVTGTTVTGTTANFVTVSGTTVTGGTARFTTLTGVSGVFTTATITSGVFASGTAAAPSVSVGSTTNGIFSPGTNQLAIATSGTTQVTFGGPSVQFPIQLVNAFTPNSERADILIGSNATSNNAFRLGTLASSNGITLQGTRQNDSSLRTNLILQPDGASVGIGNTSVNALLEVNQRLADSEVLRVEGAFSASSSVVLTNWRRSGGSVAAAFKYNDATTSMSLGTTTSHKFSLRTADTDALTIDTSQRVGIGTSSPTLQFEISNGTNTGYLHPGIGTGLSIGTKNASSLSLDTNNTSRVTITSAGLVGIGTTIPGSYYPSFDDLVIYQSDNSGITIATDSPNTCTLSFADGTAGTQAYAGYIQYTHSNDALALATAGTERARIDNAGRLLVGTSSSNSSFDSALQIAGSGVGGTQLISRFDNNSAGPYLYLSKSRGAAAGTHTIVQNGDELGTVSFWGANGSAYESGARITAFVDGTPGASGDMPGRLVFSTTADGASSPTERWRYSNNGETQIRNMAEVFPVTDNACLLGKSGFRWSAVWAANGTIQTSDERTKTEILNATLGTDFVKSLRPVSYKWIEGGKKPTGEFDEDNNYIYESVPGTRTHWGFIAQEVKQAVDAAGVDFGGWVLTDKDDPDSQQALRYDQFIAPLTKALQEALEKIETLEAAVTALQQS